MLKILKLKVESGDLSAFFSSAGARSRAARGGGARQQRSSRPRRMSSRLQGRQRCRTGAVGSRDAAAVRGGSRLQRPQHRAAEQAAIQQAGWLGSSNAHVTKQVAVRRQQLRRGGGGAAGGLRATAVAAWGEEGGKRRLGPRRSNGG